MLHDRNVNGISGRKALMPEDDIFGHEQVLLLNGEDLIDNVPLNTLNAG